MILVNICHAFKAKHIHSFSNEIREKKNGFIHESCSDLCFPVYHVHHFKADMEIVHHNYSNMA